MSFAAGIAAFFAVSCAKEDTTLRYNNATMGNIVDGVFISDQGNRFNVTEQTCSGNLKEKKRAFIICDVLNSTAGTEKEYDIRLNYISPHVLVKDAVPVSEETYRNDPVVHSEFWFSGGYLNMYMTIPVKQKDGKQHVLNLLHEKKDGTYKFMVRHNAEGEIIQKEGGNNDLTIAYSYASFPVTSIITEDSARIEIELCTYLTDGMTITPESEVTTIKMDYMKSAFEQIPLTDTPKTASYSLE